MTYEEIIEEIKNAPTTWLPGLLREIVKACLVKHVFKKDGFDKTISSIKSKVEKCQNK
jgi:hypothetical protein